MSEVTIRIPTPLRPHTAGAATVTVRAGTVAEAIDALGRAHEGILEQILDGEGRVRGFVNIYVGEKNIRSLGGLETPVSGGDVVSIVPAVAGGGS